LKGDTQIVRTGKKLEKKNNKEARKQGRRNVKTSGIREKLSR